MMPSLPVIQSLQLTRIDCRSCQEPRWNDGTKCKNCGTYENPKAGISIYDTPQGGPFQFWRGKE